jgi:hypothetical protein
LIVAPASTFILVTCTVYGSDTKCREAETVPGP